MFENSIDGAIVTGYGHAKIISSRYICKIASAVLKLNKMVRIEEFVKKMCNAVKIVFFVSRGRKLSTLMSKPSRNVQVNKCSAKAASKIFRHLFVIFLINVYYYHIMMSISQRTTVQAHIR